jgi:hypothetical protein
MKDICLCGHGRPEHAGGYGHCLLCLGDMDQRSLEFTCKPGACDRFTWDPKAEDGEARR